jgi:hypothetical protein
MAKKTTVYQPNGICDIEIELKNCKPPEIAELRDKRVTLILQGVILNGATFDYDEQGMGARLQFLGDCRQWY